MPHLIIVGSLPIGSELAQAFRRLGSDVTVVDIAPAILPRAIHTYPTFAQINRRIADMRQKEALTPNAKQWIRRIVRLRAA